MALSHDGFRAVYEKALRKDEYVDWSPHTVNYAAFKQTLRLFAGRRSKLRNLLRESTDDRISEQQMNAVLLLPETDLNSSLLYDTDSTRIPLDITTRYVPMSDQQHDDHDEIASHATDSYSSSGASLTSGKRKSKASVMRRVSSCERKEMLLFLTRELDKAHAFYVVRWQGLSQRIDAKVALKAGTSEQLEEHQMLAFPKTDLGDDVLELFAFCVINVLTIRQVLIRYDAFARTFDGTPMLNYYMKMAMRQPTSFRKLLEHDELQAIADQYSNDMHGSPLMGPFDKQRLVFTDILVSSEMAESVASTGHGRLTDTFIHTIRSWFLLGGIEDQLGFEPSYLTMRGQSLTKEMEQLAEWRKKRHETVRLTAPPKKLSGIQVFHLTLNMISGFLYCMNYYIVEPSSTMYVNRLGSHDAMSGTLIGMMPLAAFFSSIPYSMWTNKSFRHPFLVSCILMIVGNLMYSLADKYSRIWVALLGRFICGLGAPKCIIRRFMADTTPVAMRTSVNAAFGMVVAAGSAMGPAMAVMLSGIEYTYYMPHYGFIFFNGLTMPGYLMAGLWITFSIIVLSTFEEPDREGLAEQKEMEQLGAIPGSPSSATHGMLGSRVGDEETVVSNDMLDYASAYQPSMKTFETPPQSRLPQWMQDVSHFASLVTFPVRICLFLLLCKVFTIESLVSATSVLSKNRYKWKVKQVGTLGFANGMMVIPFSIMVGRLSMSYQDQTLMKMLVGMGCIGLFLLIDISDLMGTPTNDYNQGDPLAVSPTRFISGYLISYLSIQSFEGVIGSTLSKVIPTALASGTLNSGLLATLVDTGGRACGDLFISAMGFISLRQLINLLFIPAFFIMLTCLIVIERYRDLLSV
ncbi:hypothetical protein MPSEU_000618000 [Mayamaea pseudoterrestris]|nr:hypothetical protein MPSEU_000618000 [Mayamaea pseudoterrestris]